MSVKIIATPSGSYRPNIEKELNEPGVVYEVLYAEDHPDMVTRYAIQHSPDIVVDDEVVCRGQLSDGELRSLLKKAG